MFIFIYNELRGLQQNFSSPDFPIIYDLDVSEAAGKADMKEEKKLSLPFKSIKAQYR